MSETRTKAVDEKFCETCGEIIKAAAEICPKCGVRQKQSAGNGDKSRMSFVLLGLFFGCLGVHNFYIGNKVKGIIQLVLTLLSLIASAVNDVAPVWVTIVAIWAFVEVIIVKTDSDGNKLL